MEEKGIVARDCLPPEPRCPPETTPGNGQRSAGLRRTIPCNYHFLLHVLNSFLTMAEITPAPLRVSLWKYQRPQRTRRSVVFSPNGSSMQACVNVLRVMRHDTNSRTVINTCISACGERGGNLAPCDDIWGQIPNRRV